MCRQARYTYYLNKNNILNVQIDSVQMQEEAQLINTPPILIAQARSLCAVQEELINVFTEDGSVNSTSLPFQVSTVDLRI